MLTRRRFLSKLFEGAVLGTALALGEKPWAAPRELPVGDNTFRGDRFDYPGPGQAFYDEILTRFFVPVVEDARMNSNVLERMLDAPREHATSGRFIVLPVAGGRSLPRPVARAASG